LKEKIYSATCMSKTWARCQNYVIFSSKSRFCLFLTKMIM